MLLSICWSHAAFTIFPKQLTKKADLLAKQKLQRFDQVNFVTMYSIQELQRLKAVPKEGAEPLCAMLCVEMRGLL